MSEEGTGTQPLGLGQTLNALMPTPSIPSVPSPSLEQEIRRLVARFGSDAVKLELKVATKKPRGRVPEKDWVLMRDDLMVDARDWLEGRDPSARSNYSIAQRISREHPGHSAPATFRRIQRKLAAKRFVYMLYSAMELAAKHYPFEAHFRTLEALSDQKGLGGIWHKILEMDREILERHRELHGEPEPTMTWKQIEDAPRYPVNSLASLLSVPTRRTFGTPLPR